MLHPPRTCSHCVHGGQKCCCRPNCWRGAPTTSSYFLCRVLQSSTHAPAVAQTEASASAHRASLSPFQSFPACTTVMFGCTLRKRHGLLLGRRRLRFIARLTGGGRLLCAGAVGRHAARGLGHCRRGQDHKSCLRAEAASLTRDHAADSPFIRSRDRR